MTRRRANIIDPFCIVRSASFVARVPLCDSGCGRESQKQTSADLAKLEAGFDFHVAKPAALTQLEELFFKRGNGRVIQ
jgi:hypothetical protein